MQSQQTPSHKILGPLRGQEFRQQNLMTMGIQKVDQHSESIHVDSEASIKKSRKVGQRTFFKSLTYKELMHKDSFAASEKMDSPLNQSLNVPLQMEKPRVSIKHLGSVNYSVGSVAALFLRKMLHYGRQYKQLLLQRGKYDSIIGDIAHEVNMTSIDKLYCWRLKVPQLESYERFIIDILFIILLLAYTIIDPMLPLGSSLQLYISLIIVSLMFIYLIIDIQKAVEYIIMDIILYSILIGQLQLHYLSIGNLLMILKIHQISNRISIVTQTYHFKLIQSLMYIWIYSLHMANYWMYLLDRYTYIRCLTNQLNMIFSFTNTLIIDDDWHLILDSINRGLSLLLLLNFLSKLYSLLQSSYDNSIMLGQYEILLRQTQGSSQPLRFRYLIRQFLWNKLRQSHQKNESLLANQINDILPNDLRQELHSQNYFRIMQKSSFIKQKLTEQFQQAIVEHMSEAIFQEGELLQVESEQAQRLYFLDQGLIQINVKDRKVHEITPQNCLNQFEFFSGLPSQYAILVKSKAKVLFIDLDIFNEQLRLHPIDFESVRMWADRMTYNPDIRTKYKLCYICKMNSHLTLQCPQVFYIPRIPKVLSDSTYTRLNDRQKQYRNEKRRFNSLTNQNLISITAINFAQHHNLIGRNNENVDIYLGLAPINEECNLFVDDEHTSKYQQTHTYTCQQSELSPKTKGMPGRDRERERVHTLDSNVNRTLTLRTLKQSEHETHRQKQANDSIVVTTSPQIKPQNLIVIAQQSRDQVKRSSNVSNSLTIDRGPEKKSSYQSQQQGQAIHSTSILQSQQVLQLLSNLGSPNIQRSLSSKLKDQQSIQVYNKSETLHLLSELLPSVEHIVYIKDFEIMRDYQYYYPNGNCGEMIEKYLKYLTTRFSNNHR